jgi:ssDNA-binding Zn-finger/Zn-ribbon topoisomerase 1
MNQNCPYCGGKPKLQDSIVIYKTRSYGNVWTCENYPTCDTYVGCHKNTNKPLGTFADAELRRIRNIGHATFDRIWKEKFLTRSQAYGWLANHLLIHIDKTHFAMFDKNTALKAIQLADDYYNALIKNKKQRTT